MKPTFAKDYSSKLNEKLLGQKDHIQNLQQMKPTFKVAYKGLFLFLHIHMKCYLLAYYVLGIKLCALK